MENSREKESIKSDSAEIDEATCALDRLSIKPEKSVEKDIFVVNEAVLVWPYHPINIPRASCAFPFYTIPFEFCTFICKAPELSKIACTYKSMRKSKFKNLKKCSIDSTSSLIAEQPSTSLENSLVVDNSDRKLPNWLSFFFTFSFHFLTLRK